MAGLFILWDFLIKQTGKSAYGNIVYEYTEEGYLKKTTYNPDNTPGGTVVEADYDALGNVKTIKLDGAEITSYNYTYSGKAHAFLTGVTDKVNGDKNYTFSYDSTERLTRLNYPRNAMVYGYNAKGHIAFAKALYVDSTGRESVLTLSDTGSLQGGRDGNYNIKMRNTLHGTKTYAYDSANRLLQERYENNQSKNYTYNYAGNRKSMSGAVENGPYTYGSNSMNEITALNTGTGAVSYGYDARGNLQSRGADMFYWDYKNRLIGANVGGNSVSYKYSGGDLRLARTKDGKTTLYFYHGNSLIAEKTSDGKVRKVFTHDNRGVLGMTRYVYDETDTYKSKQNLYYMFDDLGSVTAITDDTGTPVQTYMYDAYGNVTNTQNDPINNFAFVGRYGGFRDWDTGLTQFLHRWYDSKDGRWLSRDPIGVNGGVNLYNYTDNNPVNRVDVTGLCGEKDVPEKPKEVCCELTGIKAAVAYGGGASSFVFSYKCTDGKTGMGSIVCGCAGLSVAVGIQYKKMCGMSSYEILATRNFIEFNVNVTIGVFDMDILDSAQSMNVPINQNALSPRVSGSITACFCALDVM